MGLFDELKKLARPYEDEEFEEDAAEQEEEEVTAPEPEPVRRNVRRVTPRTTHEPAYQEPQHEAPAWRESYERPAARPTASDKVLNINATTQLQVVLVKPDKFENASDIADHLREKRTVVLNLESTNKDIARRLVDFLSGVAYAQEGKIKRISAATYLITPYNVDIIGDLVEELESNGLYL